MKNLKMLAALLLLFAICFSVLNATSNAREKAVPIKDKSVRPGKSKKQYHYYAVINLGGNGYEFFCVGGGSGGSVSDVYSACINDTARANGTASGSFSLSGGAMTLSNVYFTVPPYREQGPYSGGAEWSTNPITINCGSGGGPQ